MQPPRSEQYREGLRAGVLITGTSINSQAELDRLIEEARAELALLAFSARPRRSDRSPTRRRAIGAPRGWPHRADALATAYDPHQTKAFNFRQANTVAVVKQRSAPGDGRPWRAFTAGCRRLIGRCLRLDPTDNDVLSRNRPQIEFERYAEAVFVPAPR
jgi:hypothetical protein